MLTSRTPRLAVLTVLGALIAAASTGPAASAAGHPNARPSASGTPAAVTGHPATIVFDTATDRGDQYTRTTTGTFAMTGRFADAGILRMSYRFAGARIDATATLIGARGMFALSLRGASGATVAGVQSGAGRWRVCGGTGAYRRLHGHGRWQADTDFTAAPAGLLSPAIRGVFVGRLHRGSAPVSFRLRGA